MEENVNRIQEVFANDDSLILRYFENEQKPDRFGCILYLEGMVKRDVIEENIVKPVMEKCLPTDKERFVDMIALRVLFSSDVVQTPYEDEAISQLISGKTLLLFEGCREALAVGTQNPKSRGITEPEAEKIMIGPREGFIELIMDNVTMLRRKLKSPDLKFFFMKLGTRSQTKVCICHLEGIANTKILEELKKRLSQIEIDGLLSANYILELISDSPYSPFQTIGFTERPDVVAAKLLEGRIAVMVDGTPVVLTLPFLFHEYLQSSEDYYNSFYFTSINRLLRVIGLIITVSAPAVYVAILTYHQEIIPTPLLLSISAARQGVPFPT
ncbi:MAG: spore germination protein, partial [Clostridia bacterium]|nr:spore germination protein [Clostridia bacterium]